MSWKIQNSKRQKKLLTANKLESSKSNRFGFVYYMMTCQRRKVYTSQKPLNFSLNLLSFLFHEMSMEYIHLYIHAKVIIQHLPTVLALQVWTMKYHQHFDQMVQKNDIIIVHTNFSFFSNLNIRSPLSK